MEKAKLQQVLDAHKLWRQGGEIDTIGVCANFDEARLRVELSELDLVAASFVKADLTLTNLVGTSLHRANMSKANLSHANLSGAKLIETDLSGANLRNTDFSGADLEGASLKGANTTDANFTRASLRGVFIDTNTKNQILGNVIITDIGTVHIDGEVHHSVIGWTDALNPSKVIFRYIFSDNGPNVRT